MIIMISKNHFSSWKFWIVLLAYPVPLQAQTEIKLTDKSIQNSTKMEVSFYSRTTAIEIRF